jgi:hypothetical protein
MEMMTLAMLAWLAVDPDPGLARAQIAFRETRNLCEADAGRLWGVNLCGPVLIADFDRQRLLANQQDPGQQLQAHLQAFAGDLPTGHSRANTALDWSGLRWTQVLAPLPDKTRERMRLLMHESFHRVQPELGLSGKETNPVHLDEESGRYWQRMEWRALAVALRSEGDRRWDAVRDAWAFRQCRQQRFGQARNLEWLLVRNEGMAEYTGVKLAWGADAELQVAAALEKADGWSSLPRQFAYATGPAWGLLLDQASRTWRERLLGGADLNDLISEELPVDEVPPTDLRLARYGSDAVFAQERELAKARIAERRRLESRLVGGNVLVLPLAEMQMSFDYQDLQPLPPHGTVYHTITVSDRWGRIEVHGDALISTDFTRLQVPGSDGSDPLNGPGWTLQLSAGWRLIDGRLYPPN